MKEFLNMFSIVLDIGVIILDIIVIRLILKKWYSNDDSTS